MRNAALGTTAPDFTEAQWFANSGYNIATICQGQVGLGVSIKPFPVLIGGYQVNVADTLLPLLPNKPKQNIYLRKTPTDRLSNEVYATTEDEPSGFTKQLIATVVTDDEYVTTAITRHIGISIPPNDSGGTRYLANTDGVCGWVSAATIASTGATASDIHGLSLFVGPGNAYAAPGANNIVATGNITAFSDASLKEDVKVIDFALSKVNQLRGVTYTRNDLKDKSKRYTGVIAQELEVVLPEAVETNDNGIKHIAYGNVIGLLIESIKEMTEEINKLKAKLAGKTT
jgi:hypothetical protein